MGSKGPKFSEQKAWDSQEKAAQLQSKYGTYGVNSALGSLNTVQNEDGTYSLSYGMNDSDRMRQNLINQGLTSLNMDPSAAQQAYYNQATRQLLPQFQQDQDRLHEQLVNRGITEGSSLYNDQMDKLRQNQNNQLANISDQAVFQGQQYLSNQIGNIGSLASQYDIYNIPSMSGTTGAQFNEVYSQKYAADRDRYDKKVAARTGMMKTIGGGIGSAIGAYFGGPMGAAMGKQLGESSGQGTSQAMEAF